MTNGVLWSTVFQGDEDNIRHALYGSWLVRDWNEDSTSLTGFSPFESADGNLVDTLFESSNPGGPWFDLGYLDDKGPSFNKKIQVKPTKVMQSRWAARYDYIEQSEEIDATLMESNPVVDCIDANQLLSNLTQQVGSTDYSFAQPVELDLVWRQCLFIGVDGRSGLNYYTVRVYPKVLFTDFGKTDWNAESTASIPVKCMAVPDEWTVPPDGVTIGSPRWVLRDGPGWRAQGQGNFTKVIPTATETGSTTATLAFTTPAGFATPVTYAAKVQTTSGGSFATATLASDTGTVSGTTTTLDVTGLTASTTYNAFEVTITDNNSVSVTSAASNSITTPA